MSDSNRFLDRWSRRKVAARKPARPATEPPRPDNGTGNDREAPATGLAPEPREAPGTPESALPDIESLKRHSDFAAFMREGVPDALRKRALRKLWRLDPAFSRLDGLVEYGEDYNAPARAPAAVRTAWRIGRGMAEPTSGEAADETAPETRRETGAVRGKEGSEAGREHRARGETPDGARDDEAGEAPPKAID